MASDFARLRPLVLAAVLAATSVAVTPMGMAETRASTDAAQDRAMSDLAQRRALKIIAFGSSSTEGAGASSAAFSYPSLLQVELRKALPPDVAVTVLNRGIGGEDADDMLRRLPGIVAEHPDMVIWQTGSNDPMRGVPLARFVRETRAGVAVMRRAGIAVMLMELQDCAVLNDIPGAIRYRDAVRTIGIETRVPVIRRYDLMRRWLADKAVTPAALMSSDALHMADRGYELLAHAVAQAIIADIGYPAPSGVARNGD